MNQQVSVLTQLAELKEMKKKDLQMKWLELFDKEAPRYGPGMMRKRLAYRIQERACGGVSDEARKRIVQIQKISARRDERLPVTGTILCRVYDDTEHQVKILEKGFEYGGQQYRSLSAIAKNITGTNWNGHAFFGLRSKRKT